MDWMKQVADKAAAANPVRVPIIPARVPGRVVHIDADYAAYYCAGNADCSPGRARLNVLDRVETAKVMSGAGKAVMHLTESGSHKAWRYIIATVKPYQGQRGGGKPENWEFLRTFLENYNGEAFTVKRWNEREADDGIALAAYNTKDPVIYTRDKDMRMLPGLHLNWVTSQMIQVGRDPETGMAEWDVQGEDGLQYGIKWFALQLLQGDSADWIPGLPHWRAYPEGPLKRMGDKTAQKVLWGMGREEAFREIFKLYQSFYGMDWADRFAEQAGLLWLRTDPICSWMGWCSVVPEHDALQEAIERVDTRINDALEEAALCTV